MDNKEIAKKAKRAGKYFRGCFRMSRSVFAFLIGKYFSSMHIVTAHSTAIHPVVINSP
ncbi:MAG: hypothetical protein IKS49_05750 [Actinomycetaceae bacterium]|nr:hypothetical protein [Actinomycetaceae bacterium]